MDINWKMKGRKILKKLSKTNLYRYHTVYQLPKEHKYIYFWDWSGDKHFGLYNSFRFYIPYRTFFDLNNHKIYYPQELTYWKYVIR